jgi:hypothetical protein
LELAEELGVERSVSALLITRGTALNDAGEIQQGVEIAERLRDVMQLTRGLNNLAEEKIRIGDSAGALSIYADMRAELSQLGLAPYLLWLDVSEAALCFVMGDWERAVELVRPMHAALEAGETNYYEGDVRHIRAVVRQVKGDVAGAIQEAELGLAAVQRSRDPQSRVPMLGGAAGVFARAGYLEKARATLDEALALCTSLELPYYSFAPNLMLPALDLGLEAAFLECFAPHADADAWTGPAVTACHGDLLVAAEDMSRCGAAYFEAELAIRAAARMRADGDAAGADEQVLRALAFYRSVGATADIAGAEALLGPTVSRGPA